ncbi:NAD(P)-dependent dehydrogenase, short-chain alcohol dehydrogenase family [Fibrobacter sp. UWT2]|uniref:SDR family NAD(P)-dependent oxidoreductase n=1 Tax=Fibrobacter sp. UWT2 TaxID=1896224 RepID=UPI0009241617|nr:SDR family oxidoreductase [Fibrobacter sp. UWT2]SHK85480.1 NAD(P)-dependent dehydrogenase, short-chain alcohol dehydrogenase family [Fibrobacter sp. UWT2]
MDNSLNPFSLENKTILVTGASSGIGQAIAIACAKMGATVVATARNEARLQGTLQQMPKGNHALVSADLTKEDEIERLIQSIPVLDGIVHCAGVGSRVPCKSLDKNSIAAVMMPNFEAPVLLQAAILANKKINKGASIVFIASKAYELPSVGNAVYSASKGAIVSYSKCLALELAPRQIRVNCICPAMVWTNLILQDALTKEELESAQKAYPLKRYGNPEDIANLAIYLLSGASSWMTGSAIDLTGGALVL